MFPVLSEDVLDVILIDQAVGFQVPRTVFLYEYIKSLIIS